MQIGTTVGTLSTTDPDAGNTFTYTLATGGADNGSFQIVGNTVQTAASLLMPIEPLRVSVN